MASIRYKVEQFISLGDSVDVKFVEGVLQAVIIRQGNVEFLRHVYVRIRAWSKELSRDVVISPRRTKGCETEIAECLYDRHDAG